VKRPPRQVWVVRSEKLHLSSAFPTKREAVKCAASRTRQFGADCEFTVVGPYILAERVRMK
jgi:hypothetical protein